SKMVIISERLYLFLFYLLLYVAYVDGQSSYIYCNEFISPKRLTAKSSIVDVIKLPIRGTFYSRNQLCEWRISCDEGEVIQLQVIDCSIQDRDIRGQCNRDYVNIYDIRDEEQFFIARFCGTEKGMVYRSTGTQMIVQFFSDDVYEYGGIRLSYTSQRAESSDGLSKDMTVQLAVGIPVGVLVTLSCVLTAIIVYRIHRKRRSSRGTVVVNESSSSQLSSVPCYQRATTEAEPFQSAAAGGAGGLASGRGPPSWGRYNVGQGYGDRPRNERGEGHFYGDMPLQVNLHGELDHETGGRSSPPPAYESLGYDENPVTPPPYEAVVKDAEEADRQDPY
ncbi:cephalotocin receptor 1, partial [Plakobranchus ocellatus]